MQYLFFTWSLSRKHQVHADIKIIRDSLFLMLNLSEYF